MHAVGLHHGGIFFARTSFFSIHGVRPDAYLGSPSPSLYLIRSLHFLLELSALAATTCISSMQAKYYCELV